MTAMYRKEYKKPWTFTKPGVVLLSEKRIIVLEEGTHLKNAMPHIINRYQQIVRNTVFRLQWLLINGLILSILCRAM